MVKYKIINNSSREIPQELTEEMMFRPLSEVQQILEEYNLKITKFDVEFDDNGHAIKQTLTIEDFKR